jgi:NADH dehydrogenase/NADH:ubiquinone oxidoreductase subunit G
MTVLEAAKNANIYILICVTMKELSPGGLCRLCVVEVVQEDKNRVVQSCVIKVVMVLRC